MTGNTPIVSELQSRVQDQLQSNLRALKDLKKATSPCVDSSTHDILFFGG